MRRTTGLVTTLLGLVGLTVALGGCPKTGKVTTAPPTAPRHSFNVSAIRSFTDTYAVSSVVDTPSNLFVGSTRGLVRWDVANAKYSVITTKDACPPIGSPRSPSTAPAPSGSPRRPASRTPRRAGPG